MISPLVCVWIRSESASYGAEKYAKEVSYALNSFKNNSLFSKVCYITPKSKYFIFSSLYYILWFFSRKSVSDINVYTFPFMPLPLDTRHDILIFHHADPCRGSIRSRITEFFGLIVLKFVSKEQLIITVSPFWEFFLREKFGFTNIKTIYNPLSSKLFQEVENLDSTLRKCQYPKLKIYLGNASPKKGWPIALKVAKKVFPEADYWVSGNIRNDLTGVKINHFRGDDIAFIEFLKTVDISIFYSQFLEGWNRTLVEAALLSRSYVLNCSNSGGSINVSTLIPSIVSFQNDIELYNHLLRIKSCVRENKVYVDFDTSCALNTLAPSKFRSEWNLTIDRYLYNVFEKFE